jgi:hypothetical protein
MNKKYILRLTDAEREHLDKLVRRGRVHTRKLTYARILLKTDADGPHHWTDERIAEAFEVSTAALSRERQHNRLGASVDWRFRTEDARIKLRSLYPS